MKKIICLVCTITLILGSANVVSADLWNSYFGLNKGWYEGMKASLESNSDSGFVVNVSDIGWGGCWGGQVFQKPVSIKKRKKYRIKFTIKSSKLNKWVYFKIGNEDGSKINFAKWIDCKKGKKVKIDKTFKAKYNGDSIYFGLGGDFGDRAKVKTDKDAKVRYKYAPDKKLDGRLPSDYAAGHPTFITCSGFSFKSMSVSLNKKIDILDKGEKTTLKLKYAKGKVKWTASNKRIIKMIKVGKNKVVIKALGTGLTTVTAKYKKKKYKCKIAIF